MKLHTEELKLAQAYAHNLEFEGLTDAQMKSIMDRGRELHRWYKSHSVLHIVIGIAVFVFVFAADYWTLLGFPRLVLPAGQEHSTTRILLTAAFCGALHSYLLYTLSTFSMHEGAAHNVIFPPQKGLVSRAANWIACNICRISGCEPNHFALHHMSHHSKFGTADDGEFLNFVHPRRYWPTFAPLAAVFNYSDFIAHRPENYNLSRFITALCTLVYAGAYGYFMNREFGLLFTVLTLLVFFPHVGFYLDRMRQMTEHNLMPVENKNGARSFGLGFWGMLLGGGPWGSPCHWEHHLVASLPWYQQLILHVHVRSLLTPRQKEQFLLQPVVGWPKLYWRLIREPAAFERAARKAGGVLE